MATFWERVGQLTGQTLRTKTGKAFHVDAVDSQFVTVTPERTGTPRPIRRIEFEAAYDLHLPFSELTAIRLQKEKVTVVNPVYIVSILKALEGILPEGPSPQYTVPISSDMDNAEEFISQLERIGSMHKKGILSDQDFAQAKLKLLKVTE